jgi:hypothetical protein
MAVASQMNNILLPWLNQVIGSTPESIAESIKSAELRGKVDAGTQLATIAIFAAAVNKATMEKFVAGDSVVLGRTVLRDALSIAGKANMTAITLLGHCLMTTSAFDDVTFVKELRIKMGVANLWAGELKTDALSEKQLKIFNEKKRKTNLASAKALGSGYLKWTGMDPNNWTRSELTVWNLKPAAPREDDKPLPTGEQGAGDKITKAAAAGKGRSSSITDEEVLGLIPTMVVDYIKRHAGSSETEIAESARTEGIATFANRWTGIMNSDPTGKRIKAARSTVG